MDTHELENESKVVISAIRAWAGPDFTLDAAVLAVRWAMAHQAELQARRASVERLEAALIDAIPTNARAPRAISDALDVTPRTKPCVGCGTIDGHTSWCAAVHPEPKPCDHCGTLDEHASWCQNR